MQQITALQPTGLPGIVRIFFAKGPEFDLNLDLIKNNRTREILQKSESLQNLYKIILGSLRKKRNFAFLKIRNIV